MSTLLSLVHSVQAAAFDVPLLAVLRALLLTSFIGALVLLFKPLLSGIGRALLLMVKPHLSREELRARGQMRDAQLFARMINGADASHAAELRAMSARA